MDKQGKWKLETVTSIRSLLFIHTGWQMDEQPPTVTQRKTRQFHDGRSAKGRREHGYPGTQTDYRRGTGNRIALA